MYREHLLSINHVQNLLYHQVDTGAGGRRSLRAPAFFISQGEKRTKGGEFFPPGSEAERRISFFAQSLTTAIPEAIPVHAMPTFTVVTPHYSEKVCIPSVSFLVLYVLPFLFVDSSPERVSNVSRISY